MSGISRSVLAGFLSLLATSAAFADSPTLIGTYKDWSAFTTSANGRRVCYTMAKPDAMEPKKAKRDPAYFMISDWPARKAKGELQIMPGYQYKDGALVTATVGADKFDFFSQNEGGQGKAWVEDAGEEKRIVEAMKGGAKLVVSGTSQRGTNTKDTYSLGGLSDALQKVHEACGM
jgi:Invasion associated locus B (IalB) protein